MIFKEIRILGTKPYPCYLEIMTESVAVCLLFSRLIEEYKLRASCSWINIYLCDQKTFAENSHRNFLCHPADFYYLCDMEKVTANDPQMSDEAKRQFFFDIIQSVIREAGNFFQWDQNSSFTKAIQALKQGNPFLYSPGFLDRENVWKLDKNIC